MESYDGLGSLVDHILTYKSRMALTTNLDKLYYLAFPITLKGPKNQWFHSLKSRLGSSFDQPSKQFINQFIGMHKESKPDTQLLTVR